jgi:biotin synthase-related radical SAM superfamily protein
LEVLTERLFEWICPGKAEWVGYREWKRRLIAAVDIFGRGNVGTGIVGGVETATPLGFANEEDALKSTLDEAEDLASHGVTTVYIVWVPRPDSQFRNQKAPSLEYFVKLAKGLHDLRVHYGLGVDFDDYRRCGNHPDSDLSRLL